MNLGVTKGKIQNSSIDRDVVITTSIRADYHGPVPSSLPASAAARHPFYHGHRSPRRCLPDPLSRWWFRKVEKDVASNIISNGDDSVANKEADQHVATIVVIKEW